MHTPKGEHAAQNPPFPAAETPAALVNQGTLGAHLFGRLWRYRSAQRATTRALMLPTIRRDRWVTARVNPKSGAQLDGSQGK